MAVIMYGKEVAEDMLRNWQPYKDACLYILSNEDDPASQIYVRNKKNKCQEQGIGCEVFNISQATILDIRILLNNYIPKKGKNYIIFQKPLPKQLQPYEGELDKFLAKHPKMDIDAFEGDLTTEFKTPATPLGIVKMLDYYVGLKNLDGMNAVVIGRSKIVGEPMARLLTKLNCTVTLCHSHTKDLKQFTKNADLIVCAVGKPKFLTSEYIGDESPIIVDVGINRDENGNLCGDVDFNSVEPKCSFISPVPKGVGVLTVASLVYKMGERI